jgi:hypothetical protein
MKKREPSQPTSPTSSPSRRGKCSRSVLRKIKLLACSSLVYLQEVTQLLTVCLPSMGRLFRKKEVRKDLAD